MAEDALLELVQRRPRLQAQFVDEVPARGAVDVQRLRLPPGSIEGEHDQLLQPFASGVALRLRDQRPDQAGVASEAELGCGPHLEGTYSPLVERRGVGAQRGLAGQPGEDRAAPQPERLAGGRRGGGVVVALECRPGVVRERREREVVEPRAIPRQPVTGRAELDDRPGGARGLQQSTQPRDIGLDRMGRGGRR
jgi:hypothetical protein